VNERLSKLIIHMVLIFACALIIFPFIVMVSNSLKPDMAVFTELSLIPKQFKWDNYLAVWRETSLPLLFRNSVVVTLLSTTLVVFVSSLGAYAFARMDFFGKKLIYFLILSALLVPPQAVMVPMFMITRRFNLVNTYFALVGPYVTFGFPLCLFILTNYLESFPRAIEESAKIDGCSPFGIYWKIILPIIKPALITVIVWQVIASWNEFLYALLFMTEERMKTVPLAPLIYQASFGWTGWGKLFSLLTLIIVPVVLCFVFLQKYFIKGLTSGAVKF